MGKRSEPLDGRIDGRDHTGAKICSAIKKAEQILLGHQGGRAGRPSKNLLGSVSLFDFPRPSSTAISPSPPPAEQERRESKLSCSANGETEQRSEQDAEQKFCSASPLSLRLPSPELHRHLSHLRRRPSRSGVRASSLARPTAKPSRDTSRMPSRNSARPPSSLFDFSPKLCRRPSRSGVRANSPARPATRPSRTPNKMPSRNPSRNSARFGVFSLLLPLILQLSLFGLLSLDLSPPAIEQGRATPGRAAAAKKTPNRFENRLGKTTVRAEPSRTEPDRVGSNRTEPGRKNQKKPG